MSTLARARDALTSAYEAAGGHDAELFGLLTAKYIADGTVAVADDGTVTGVAEIVQKVREAKPPLFKAGGGTPAPGAPAMTPLDLLKPSTRGTASLTTGTVVPRDQIRAAVAALKGGG